MSPVSRSGLLPSEGGDARLIGNRLGGFEKIASHADVVLAGAQRLGADLADEERIRKDRKDLNVSAILHSSYPVRHWDHDLGPGATIFCQDRCRTRARQPRPST